MALFALANLFPTRQTPIERQLGHLRREIASVSGAVRHLGSAAGASLSHGATEFGDQVMHQGAIVARRVGKQALRAGNAVRNDPVPTLVAIASLALLIRLFSSSR